MKNYMKNYMKTYKGYNKIEEQKSGNRLYFEDTDTYGEIIHEDDKIVKFINISDTDGKQYDKTTYSYIKSHFDDLVKNGRIERMSHFDNLVEPGRIKQK